MYLVLNAMDAAAKGAEINVQTECGSAERERDTWSIRTKNRLTGEEQVYAGNLNLNFMTMNGIQKGDVIFLHLWIKEEHLEKATKAEVGYAQ